MDIREILLTLKSPNERKYYTGSNKANYISKAEKHIKKFIYEKVCDKNNHLRFYNVGFNFRTKKCLYKKRILCRLFGNEELMNTAYFHLMIYFNVDDLEAGIKIDRFSKRLGVSNKVEEDILCKNEIDTEVARLMYKKFRIKNYNADKQTFSFKDKDDSDKKFILFIRKHLKTLLPIYWQLVQDDFKFTRKIVIPLEPEKIYNPDDFHFRELSESGLSKNKKEKEKDRPSNIDFYERVKRAVKNYEKGKNGEQIVNHKLQEKKDCGEIQDFKWVSTYSGNPDANDNLGYDFKVVKQNTTFYLEVKTTTCDCLYITDKELKILKETFKKKKQKYSIWVVNLETKDIYKIPGKKIINARVLKPTMYTYRINPKDFN